MGRKTSQVKKSGKPPASSEGADQRLSHWFLCGSFIAAEGIPRGWRMDADMDYWRRDPGDESAFAALEYALGSSEAGLLAGYLVFLARRGAGMDGTKPEPRDEYLCAGILRERLGKAVREKDGSFFRTLAEMIDCDYDTPPGSVFVRAALFTKAELEREGKPVTKKAVEERTEIQLATKSLTTCGQPVTDAAIKQRRDALGLNWPRIWKGHPDLAALPTAKAGRRPTKRAVRK